MVMKKFKYYEVHTFTMEKMPPTIEEKIYNFIKERETPVQTIEICKNFKLRRPFVTTLLNLMISLGWKIKIELQKINNPMGGRPTHAYFTY